MPTDRTIYVNNANTLIPWTSTPAGNTTKGVEIIVFEDATLNATTMLGALQEVITDYYSNRVAGDDANDMTNWVTGAGCTGIVSLATADAFNPYASAEDQYTWAVGLNGGALNFIYGNTGCPTCHTGGISASAIDEQISMVKVTNASGIIDNTKLAWVGSSPGYRDGSTARYRGPKRIAAKYTSSSVPSTLTVTAYPGIIMTNCVTNANELVIGDPVTVGTC